MKKNQNNQHEYIYKAHCTINKLYKSDMEIFTFTNKTTSAVLNNVTSPLQ